MALLSIVAKKPNCPHNGLPQKYASCLLKFWLLDLFPPPSLFFKATKTATRTPLLETLRLTRKGENRVEIALFSRREKAAFSSSPPLFFAVFNKREGDAEKDASQWPHSTLLNCSLHRRRRHPLPPTEKRSCERKEFPPPSHSVSRLSIRFWFEPLSSAAVSATIGARRPLLLPCSLLHCRTDRPTMPLFFARGKRKKGMANGGKLLLRMLRYDTRHAPRVSYCMGGHCTVGVCPGIERGREGGRNDKSFSFPLSIFLPFSFSSLEDAGAEVGRRACTMCFSSSGTNLRDEIRQLCIAPNEIAVDTNAIQR